MSKRHISLAINIPPEKSMNPINQRPRIDINLYKKPVSQTNQPSADISPEGSLPQSGNPSFMPDRQEVQPSRVESQRTIYTVDRMNALSPGSRLMKNEDLKFLRLLDRYGAGEPMDVLKKDQPNIDHFLNHDGLAHRLSAKAFWDRLEPEERLKVQEAIKSRQQRKSVNPLLNIEGSHTRNDYAKVLSLLGLYATGKSTGELRKIFPAFTSYLNDKGLGKSQCANIFWRQLSSQHQADVLRAIEERKQRRTGNHSRLCSSTRNALASSRSLEWAKSNIEPSSFRAVIEALTLTEHPEVNANMENVALYADIPAETLRHLLQSEKRSDGTSQFQLTKLGDEYVNDQFPDEKENILKTIAYDRQPL